MTDQRQLVKRLREAQATPLQRKMAAILLAVVDLEAALAFVESIAPRRNLRLPLIPKAEVAQ